MNWSHQPVGKYVLIEWRAADHGNNIIDRGEVKALGREVKSYVPDLTTGLVAVFRQGTAHSVTQMEDGAMELLVNVDNIVAIATPWSEALEAEAELKRGILEEMLLRQRRVEQ
jgi:hypothetical protein